MKRSVVTRTFHTTTVKVLTANVETATTADVQLVLGKRYELGKDLDKICKKIIDTDTVKFVAVIGAEHGETLYSMPEEQFLALATPCNKQ